MTRHRAQLVLTLSAACVAGALAQPAPDPALEAVLKNALIDARQLASSLPDRGRLGAEWKTAWEVPPTHPNRVASEDDYWKNLGKSLGFAGVSEAQARAMLDSLLQNTGPAMAQEGMTTRDAILAVLVKVKSDNAPTALKAVETWETAALTFRMVEQVGDNPDPKQASRRMMDLIGAPYKSLTDEQLKEQFVRTASLVQKRTQMTYYLCNNWDGLAQARSDEDIARAGIWLGMIKINLMLADPYKTSEPMDLRKEDGPALQARLLAAVRESATRGMAMQRKRLEANIDAYNERGDTSAAQRLQEQLWREATAMQSLDAKVEMLDLGDNSYITRITGVSPDAVGMQFGMFNGWLRKGPAMAEVSVGGNMPQEQMDLVMKKVLDELDAKLGSYDSSMFAAISVAGALPTDNSPPTPPPAHAQQPRQPHQPQQPQRPQQPPSPPPVVQKPPVVLPQPKDDPPTYTQGLEAYNARDMRRALQSFDAALQQSPNNPRVLLMRGASKYQLMDLAGALADYRSAAALVPEDPTYRKCAAYLELIAGDARRAVEHADAAVRLVPNDPDALLVRAQAAVAMGHHDQARQLFAEVMRLQPQRAQTLYNEAGGALQRRSYVEAMVQFESVLQLDPTMRQAHFGRGLALAGRGKNRQAIAAFQEYLKYDSTSDFANQARQNIEQLKRAP